MTLCKSLSAIMDGVWPFCGYYMLHLRIQHEEQQLPLSLILQGR